MSLGMKLGLAALAVSLVGGGTAGCCALGGTATPRQRGQAGTQGSRRLTRGRLRLARGNPGDLPPPALAPSPTESQARKPDKPRRLAGPVSRDGERLAAEDQLDGEVAVLKRAREELRLGRPAQALEALREYDRRFGKGVLDEERRAMAAIAACQAHPGPSARAQAQAFMRSSPNSPLRNRVRVACITPAR